MKSRANYENGTFGTVKNRRMKNCKRFLCNSSSSCAFLMRAMRCFPTRPSVYWWETRTKSLSHRNPLFWNRKIETIDRSGWWLSSLECRTNNDDEFGVLSTETIIDFQIGKWKCGDFFRRWIWIPISISDNFLFNRYFSAFLASHFPLFDCFFIFFETFHWSTEEKKKHLWKHTKIDLKKLPVLVVVV